MDIYYFISLIISFAIALSVHESSHALVAHWLGDPTAKNLGRISINPLRHLDPMGTILIFVIGFGWGKPVPVNTKYFKNPKKDNAMVAFAGPLSNIFLALLGFMCIKYASFDIRFFEIFISLNLILVLFNFLPIPPLDTANILEIFSPSSVSSFWELFKENAPFLLFVWLLVEHFFDLGFLTFILRLGTDFLYGFLLSIS